MRSRANSQLAMIAMALGAGMGGNLGGADIIDRPMTYTHTPSRNGYRGTVNAAANRKAKKSSRKAKKIARKK
jgi:hypothetical protein